MGLITCKHTIERCDQLQLARRQVQHIGICFGAVYITFSISKHQSRGRRKHQFRHRHKTPVQISLQHLLNPAVY